MEINNYFIIKKSLSIKKYEQILARWCSGQAYGALRCFNLLEHEETP